MVQKMSWWMKLKRILCRHSYSNENLTSCSIGDSGDIILRNYCIKCGKPFEVRMSGRYIDRMIEQDKERMIRDGYFTGK